MFRFLDPFFHALSDGKIIRLTVAWVLRAVGVLGAAGGVLGFIILVALGIKMPDALAGNRGAAFLIGCILFGLFGLALGYLWAGITFFRARSILSLGDSHFTVLSIVSILFRLIGELIFVTYSTMGLGACLFVWLADTNPFAELGSLSDIPFAARASAGFLGGLELAVLFLLIAFVGIVLWYALAELSIVLVEIALNTRGIRTLQAAAAGGHAIEQAPVSFAGNGSAISDFSKGAAAACRHCGEAVENSAAFCAECGTPVS